MSLLQDEEFVVYQLRTSYLSHIKDGVGERLINVNSSVLNNPAFRASGWQPNASDIKRTYSPPIPTAVTAEYFQAPRSLPVPVGGFGDDDEEEVGMVTGGGSNETVGPTLHTKRRRRKEQMEQDDSSDLSEDSDDEPDVRRVNTIKFAKMPLRTRAGSSPLRSTPLNDGPEVLITSPSRPAEASHLRRNSIGTLQSARPRRDTTTTTTSSELSSENELDMAFFQRRPISSKKARASQFLADRIQEDEREGLSDDDPGAESDTTMSSVLAGSADSASILGTDNGLESLSAKLPGMPPSSNPQRASPRKQRPNLATLQALPPPRPISLVAPVSLLSQALNAKNKPADVPFARFAMLSGKADPSPLYIKIFAPSSEASDEPFEILLRKASDGAIVTVSEAIGFALWRYNEEGINPKISGDKANINCWNFRMVEDGEVEYDFPALSRTRSISDFTSNNNRGARGRSREKPWDEFALVEATDKEFKDNEKVTPKYSKEAAESSENLVPPTAAPKLTTPLPLPAATPTPSTSAFRNPITGPSFSSSVFRKEATPLDAPAASVVKATPRTGLQKKINIRFTDENLVTRTTLLEVTTDTYMAEVFDQVCRRLGLEKAQYVLKVSNSTTIVPDDRTVEALGDRSELDLHRRRFIGDGIVGINGSPGSSSPNAPLLIAPGGTPKRSRKMGFGSVPALAQRQDTFFLGAGTGNFKRYHVVRKQPMSFSSSSNRVITLDSECMHIMPSEGPKAMWETQGKTTTVPFSSVVGCKVSRKHPRMFRVTVYKERESKRYDFEASTLEEAMEIVEEIRKGMDANTRLPERALEYVV